MLPAPQTSILQSKIIPRLEKLERTQIGDRSAHARHLMDLKAGIAAIIARHMVTRDSSWQELSLVSERLLKHAQTQPPQPLEHFYLSFLAAISQQPETSGLAQQHREILAEKLEEDDLYARGEEIGRIIAQTIQVPVEQDKWKESFNVAVHVNQAGSVLASKQQRSETKNTEQTQALNFVYSFLGHFSAEYDRCATNAGFRHSPQNTPQNHAI